SGSAQFTPSQLPNLKSQINHPKIFIIDLRQESHGFINDIAISFYSPQTTLNDGFTTSQTLSDEAKDLSTIPKGREVTIFHKTTRPALNVFVESVGSEAPIVNKQNMSYTRLAVKDGSIPSPQIVDQFVALIKYQSAGSHLHFHCNEGEGRTTTFMSMYQMMHNKDKLSLQSILDYQTSIGGIVLTDNLNRREFLNEFYNYTKNNKLTNFRIPYSQWIKNPK
ncbi:MAG: phosphatase, partial [Clostridium sp.]